MYPQKRASSQTVLINPAGNLPGGNRLQRYMRRYLRNHLLRYTTSRVRCLLPWSAFSSPYDPNFWIEGSIIETSPKAQYRAINSERKVLSGCFSDEGLSRSDEGGTVRAAAAGVFVHRNQRYALIKFYLAWASQ